MAANVRVAKVADALNPNEVPVYVGRKSSLNRAPVGAIDASALGNPYPVSIGRDKCISEYRIWLSSKLYSGDVDVIKSLNRIRTVISSGNDVALLCFCHPLPCHADIIKEALCYKQPKETVNESKVKMQT